MNPNAKKVIAQKDAATAKQPEVSAMTLIDGYQNVISARDQEIGRLTLMLGQAYDKPPAPASSPSQSVGKEAANQGTPSKLPEPTINELVERISELSELASNRIVSLSARISPSINLLENLTEPIQGGYIPSSLRNSINHLLKAHNLLDQLDDLLKRG